MSISSVGGSSSRYPTKSVSAPASAPAPAAGKALTSQDPRSQYLTADDRSQLKAQTGLDVTDDGSLVTPVSMSVNDTEAAYQIAGRLASDRASGAVTGSITTDYLTRLAREYHFRDASPADGQGDGASGVDVRA